MDDLVFGAAKATSSEQNKTQKDTLPKEKKTRMIIIRMQQACNRRPWRNVLNTQTPATG